MHFIYGTMTKSLNYSTLESSKSNGLMLPVIFFSHFTINIFWPKGLNIYLLHPTHS